MKEKNEAGYTLVLVLLTITLIFIFSLTLISSVLNSASQNKKTEENIQLNRLSEMGVTYMEKVVKEANKQANESIVKWLNSGSAPSNPNIPYEYKGEFETALDNLIETNPTLEKKLEEDGERFKIVINAISLENTNTIKVVYTVTPSLTTEYPETLSSQHTITINLNIN
ncbi:hypothetical protein [Peribacillus asahii]|uniref:hypothetical protein n=1 Tax=Peribacillus asahii TaxID=228899 RepID=UPI00380EA897